MSNHVPVFYTWEARRDRGGKKRRDKGEKPLPLQVSVYSHWLCKLPASISLLLFMSHTFMEVMFFHALSLSLSSIHSPLCFSPPLHVSLLRQFHEGSDSCFTLVKLHIWQLHICPGLPPVFPLHTRLLHYRTQSHHYVLWKHRWDDNLQHRARFPTNEAEISCWCCCVLFNMKYNKSLHVCYICPKVAFNSCKWKQ